MTTKTKETHPSLQRLLAVAHEVAQISGPSALAEKLVESEQTVTNWRTRGVSEKGALKAQKAFRCDANYILDGSTPKMLTHDPSAAQQAREPAPSYGWPFKEITAYEYNNMLKKEDRLAIESHAVALLNQRGGATKQESPEKIAAIR